MFVNDFVGYMQEGREIELKFHDKWYYFGTYNTKKIRIYMFYEMLNEYPNDISLFNDIDELLNIKINGCDLEYILENTQDYFIF